MSFNAGLPASHRNDLRCLKMVETLSFKERLEVSLLILYSDIKMSKDLFNISNLHVSHLNPDTGNLSLGCTDIP